MAARDEVGSRGESIFVVRLTDLCGRKRPSFRPHFLGEKAETLDYFIELVDAGPPTPYFFVQVRTTRQGYTQRSPRRLKVSVAGRDVSRLANYPAPVYLVGIDEVQECGFILAILSGSASAIPSLPTRFPLDCANLRVLYDEVSEFWAGNPASLTASAFVA
jgi:hypothetical protein